MSEGQKMEASLFIPEGTGPFPAVIILPGFSSNEKRFFDLAEMLRNAHIATLTLNMRGHGESEGELYSTTASDLAKDAIPAYDFLAVRPDIDPARIGISGSSFGAMVGALTSEVRPVKSLLLRAPATYSKKMMITPFKEIADNEKTIFRNSQDEVIKSAAIRAIDRYTGNLLVVASGNDDVIPYLIPQMYYDRAINSARREIEILEGAPHSLSPTPEFKAKFNDRALKWFLETL
jgi:esterase/lipase